MTPRYDGLTRRSEARRRDTGHSYTPPPGDGWVVAVLTFLTWLSLGYAAVSFLQGLLGGFR